MRRLLAAAVGAVAAASESPPARLPTAGAASCSAMAVCSSSTLCCGSMASPSAGVRRKAPGSKASTPSRKMPSLTYIEEAEAEASGA